MKWYLVKYQGAIWEILKTFSDQAAAEEYQKVLEDKNRSQWRYLLVVGSALLSNDKLAILVSHKVNEVSKAA